MLFDSSDSDDIFEEKDFNEELSFDIVFIIIINI